MSTQQDAARIEATDLRNKGIILARQAVSDLMTQTGDKAVETYAEQTAYATAALAAFKAAEVIEMRHGLMRS